EVAPRTEDARQQRKDAPAEFNGAEVVGGAASPAGGVGGHVAEDDVVPLVGVPVGPDAADREQVGGAGREDVPLGGADVVGHAPGGWRDGLEIEPGDDAGGPDDLGGDLEPAPRGAA